MQITIIGTGNMARGIGTRAVAGGHDVTVVGTEPEKAQALAGELGGSARAGERVEGDVVVLAVPYAAAADVVKTYGDQLDGKVVVDITNPVDLNTFEPLQVEGSGAQQIASAAASGARLVKAFNTTFAGTLVEGRVAGEPPDVFVASDDEEAKRAVRRLAEDGGLRAVDAGPLANARQLEALGYLHMAIQDSLGTGYASAVKILA